ncbi:hypothetical protein ACRE1U_08675, partial [Helicobacter himalayensis]|uniref:hypothetical protein n=1 Tax=Helicobacter himalayensis TaxID=1591088 RepID=UPI003D6E6404
PRAICEDFTSKYDNSPCDSKPYAEPPTSCDSKASPSAQYEDLETPHSRSLHGVRKREKRR